MEIKSSANNITITDMKIANYDENNSGGAIDITSGAVTLQDIHFDNNETTSSSDDGGAIYIGSGTTVTVDRCKFTNNESYNNQYANGSCIYSEGTTTIQNCLFYDNVCNNTSYPGHVYVGENTTNLVNCTFAENGSGDPLAYYGNSATGAITNCIFYGNASSNDIKEWYVTTTKPTVSYTYYESRTGDFNTGSESNNITSGAIGFTNSGSNDFSITASSPCLNTGSSAAPRCRF